MKNKYTALVLQCEQKLIHNAENTDLLKRAELNLKLIRHYVQDLRDAVLSFGFQNDKAEQYFFKETKPRLVSKGIYYNQLFTLLSKQPKGSLSSQEKYLSSQMNRLEQFFQDHLDFYNYYRRGNMALDSYYFMRGKEAISFNYPFVFYCEEQFATSHDGIVAMFLAYQELISFIRARIEKLYTSSVHTLDRPQLKWTGTKTDLIELIYSLHTVQYINGGAVEIKEIAVAFGSLFDIDLDDIYRTFIEIRSRKINLTKFLDLLKERLLKRMYEADE